MHAYIAPDWDWHVKTPEQRKDKGITNMMRPVAFAPLQTEQAQWLNDRQISDVKESSASEDTTSESFAPQHVWSCSWE